MTTITDTDIAPPEPKRDRYGRYIINGTPHTRATTITKTLSDTYGLTNWKLRMVAHGLGQRPDLHALAATTNPDTHKKTLDRICQDAMDAAAAGSGANIGTALHTATETVDRGHPCPPLPNDLNQRVNLYTQTLNEAGIRIDKKRIEQIVTIPDWNGDGTAPPIAGTLDRIVTLPDRRKIVADLKTGKNLDYSWQEISMQLAIYANHTKTYDPVKDKTLPPIQNLDRDQGLIIHLPSSGPIECTLYLIDLWPGHTAVDYAMWVRDWRKTSGLATVYRPSPTPPGDTDQQPDTRWVRWRIQQLKGHPEALNTLRQLWPETITKPMPEELTNQQIIEIAAVLDHTEAAHELPLHRYTNRPGGATTPTNKHQTEKRRP